MKKYTLLLLLTLLLTGCGSEELDMKSGWQDVYYLDNQGVPVTGWQDIEGSRYYFSPEHGGAMVTGWLELPQGRYYFDSSGIMQTGWLEQSGKRYYLRPDGNMAVGTVWIEGQKYHFTSAGALILLVNLDHPLPEDYTPQLVELEGFRVSADCAQPLLAMMLACRDAGHRCLINSAYRDENYQQVLWDNRYNKYIDQGYSLETAAELSAQYVMPPGHSEHHTGLAVDLTGTEQMYSWLAQHAPQYGFILRYPQDKINWTGVTYEPWHFRYVGRELALELQELELTLEEYLFQLTEASHCTG